MHVPLSRVHCMLLWLGTVFGKQKCTITSKMVVLDRKMADEEETCVYVGEALDSSLEFRNSIVHVRRGGV